MTTAREYLRVSADHSGRERSPQEQHDENQAAADREGFTLGEPYKDTGSASKYAQKAREDFDRLVRDLEADAFGAETLVLWESSRGSRRVGEWITLIELCEERGVGIYVTTHGRMYDPGNPRDRRTLIEDATDSEYESAKIAVRVRRGLNANLVKGWFHGPCPYGYERDYDQRRRPLRQYPDPETAPHVVELFDRILKGHSLKAISKDWAARGIVSRSGTRFSPTTLRVMAAKVSYVGLRSHNNSGPVKGSWPALVDESVFWSVQRILTDPKRKTSRPGGAKHVLSMIIRCDVCGGPLVVTSARKNGKEAPAAYRCHNGGHVRVNQEETDEQVIGAMLAYLARPEIYAELAKGNGNDAELEKVRGELARARAELAEMEAAPPPRTVAALNKVTASIDSLAEDTAALEARERELSTPSVLAGLMTPGEDVATWWEAAEVSTRRAVAGLLLSPGLLGEVRVTRSAVPNRATPVADRLVWRRPS
ncbi:recombinase family protein [Streptomyces lunaelactis]|uniref:recombinase family protein n=1 Tax=Streptomyces lunaelactis TaxID=1535768 RepID=UPI00158543F6|nr:recombinase family protein [Streptomyces lunaelactis]NUK01787.1 recombinase family protein [Streptomyces lunaelactis]NUK14977.1 recombinase family protein [Streptomyces lunaelactis]